MKHKITIKDIDDILPQTQCGLCTYDGCKPYAEAIVNDGEAINLCPPGGVKGLKKLAAITEQDATPYIDEMQQKEKPKLLAAIREEECIGCTKCISACPVDAILGASKQMHTVINDECTGCELCVEPCPVDCIDMVEAKDPALHSAHYRMRFNNREKRLSIEKANLARKHQHAKLAHKQTSNQRDTLEARKLAIQEAVERVKKR
ncbi:MAG: 4Fe-4S ferredoxin [Legionellaceae bacterium]|nr:4Fe-4S ferredoxin [Legionellaceae bacterium]